MKDTLIAVDLAKTVFEVAVSHHAGKVSEEHRLSREKFVVWFGSRQPATVVAEACGSAHHWGRMFREFGHRPATRRSSQCQSNRNRSKC